MKSRQLSILTIVSLSLLAITGIYLLAYSTPYGLSLNDDSVAYIAGARSILNGDGYREAWLVSNGPTVHFPPGFPATLALIGSITGLDPLRGARALNGLLFGLNIGLTGWLAWRMTGSRFVGLVSGIMVLLNSSLLNIHTRAMSEPLYIILTTISFLLLDFYVKRSRSFYLIFLGIVLACAYLTRYAALSLLATMLALMLVLHKDWPKRIRSILLIVVSSFPIMVSWTIRNRIVGGTFTNRVLDWHPIVQSNWFLAVETLSEFLVPVSFWRRMIPSSVFIILLILIALAIFFWTAYKGLPRFFKPSQFVMPDALPLVNGLYIVTYMLALIVTMTLFDPATKFQVRILSPIYIPIILLTGTLATWLWHKNNIAWKPAIILLTVAVLGLYSYGQYLSVPIMQNDPGFAGPGWRYSKAITVLKAYPTTTLILTNEPGLVYIQTGRPCGTLPPTNIDLTKFKQVVLDGRAVIALFRVNQADASTLAYYNTLGSGLYRIDFGRTWIFTAFPGWEKK